MRTILNNNIVKSFFCTHKTVSCTSCKNYNNENQTCKMFYDYNNITEKKIYHNASSVLNDDDKCGFKKMKFYEPIGTKKYPPCSSCENYNNKHGTCKMFYDYDTINRKKIYYDAPSVRNDDDKCGLEKMKHYENKNNGSNDLLETYVEYRLVTGMLRRFW